MCYELQDCICFCGGGFQYEPHKCHHSKSLCSFDDSRVTDGTPVITRSYYLWKWLHGQLARCECRLIVIKIILFSDFWVNNVFAFLQETHELGVSLQTLQTTRIRHCIVCGCVFQTDISVTKFCINIMSNCKHMSELQALNINQVLHSKSIICRLKGGKFSR